MQGGQHQGVDRLQLRARVGLEVAHDARTPGLPQPWRGVALTLVLLWAMLLASRPPALLRKLLLGTPAEQVFKLDAMANAGCVAWFAELAARRAAAQAPA